MAAAIAVAIGIAVRWAAARFGRAGGAVLPLNKWHMSQMQQEGAGEDTVFDFLKHVVTS
jgi:hypothetical protein